MNNLIKINNINVNYIKKGDGTPVIFLHGWGQSLNSFTPMIEELSKVHEVWAIDFPGFGESDEPDFPYTVYDYNEMLEIFIKENKIKNPSLIAHSFGVRISIIYAANNKNLNKLVFTGGAGIKPVRGIKQKLSVYNYKFMKFLCKTPLYKQFQEDLFATSGSEDYKNASNMMKKVLINTVNEDLSYLLKEIDVKTLLYWGANDDATPIEDGIKMDKEIKDSKLIIKENSGHFAYLENAPDFIEKTLKFLA